MVNLLTSLVKGFVANTKLMQKADLTLSAM